MTFYLTVPGVAPLAAGFLTGAPLTGGLGGFFGGIIQCFLVDLTVPDVHSRSSIPLREISSRHF